MPRKLIATFTTAAPEGRSARIYREGEVFVVAHLPGQARLTRAEFACCDRREALRDAAFWVWPALGDDDAEAALMRFAAQHGRRWVARLRDNWLHARVDWPDGARLHALRNNYGPEVLQQAAAAFAP